MDSTAEMLAKNLDYIADKVSEYAKQIRSGEYVSRVEMTNFSDVEGDEAFVNALRAWMVQEGIIDGEDASEEYPELVDLESALESEDYELDDDTVYRVEVFDEPTLSDGNGNHEPIDEWPLSVEVKIGRPLAVVIGTGGPHIEIVQDLSDGGAKLAGYWGGERVYRHGEDYQTVLDYFTDNLYDEAPEEYK